MEFLLLLIVTLFISVAVSLAVIKFFSGPVDKIFARIIGDEISVAWRKFLIFAMFVVGVSSGVSISRLEKFIRTTTDGVAPPDLTAQYWGLEVYRTIIDTLGGMAWALFIFFVIALIAFVIVRIGESKQA